MTYLPDKDVVIIDTEKSSSVNDTKVSFCDLLIVASSFDDNVETNCLLTLKFVSVAFHYLRSSVFKVGVVVYGNLNIEIFCLDFVISFFVL